MNDAKKLVKVIKTNDTVNKTLDDLVPKVGNTYNKMSINVYLNTHCKDAMNLTEFLENINISIEYCKDNNIYIFVVSNNIVYYKSGLINNIIFDINQNKKCTMYILSEILGVSGKMSFLYVLQSWKYRTTDV